MNEKVYGIDLGTTNSAIAVFENGKSSILKNVEGSETTPSVVFFTGTGPEGNDETLIGVQAKNVAAMAPNEVVQFIKREMGKKGDLYNRISPSGRKYSPEMISALILHKLTEDAAYHEGQERIQKVAITVPAYFDDTRRIATKHAGEIAGLQVMGVINEPTAAALAYGLDTQKEGLILVYDLGGGTFDVTLLKISDGVFDVIATDGDHALGGLNFDQKLIYMIREQLEEQGCTIDDEDDAFMADLREKAENVKIQLSTVSCAKPIFTVNGKTYRCNIDKESFEKNVKDLVNRTKILTQQLLSEQNISWDDIDEIVMVGGSTRIPCIKNLLEELSNRKLSYKVDPDTAVARGAAIFASTLETNDVSNAQNQTNFIVSDVTSQSLGFICIDAESGDKINSIIVPHNSKIPCTKSDTFYTIVDNQSKLMARITEGDDTDPEFVHIIGDAKLGLPRHPKNSPVEVVIGYDVNQIINVEVIDCVTKKNLGSFQIDREDNLDSMEVANAKSLFNEVQVD